MVLWEICWVSRYCYLHMSLQLWMLLSWVVLVARRCFHLLPLEQKLHRANQHALVNTDFPFGCTLRIFLLASWNLLLAQSTLLTWLSCTAFDVILVWWGDLKLWLNAHQKPLTEGMTLFEILKPFTFCKEPGVFVSCADCRVIIFQTLEEATRIWIKAASDWCSCIFMHCLAKCLE